jgi:hypothetical protein
MRGGVSGTERMSLTDISFRIRNNSKTDLELHLEPWGEQYSMPIGATFKVEADGPEDDVLEIEYVEGRIIVYGWSGSVVTVSG